ncbi:DUF177 domain-containing protein [Sulfidibacter corallicola]|uniref:DUF177 domain-containing protein n=1 Tax=Sulfidibacter corallicola TaxID=2818388 RepID=UPI003B219F97
MLVNLGILQSDKPLFREHQWPHLEWQTSSGKAGFEDVTASFRFRTDPLGYVLYFQVKANVTLSCNRCGGPLRLPVEVSDWVSLRTKQPADAHVVLGGDEMNIRFITDLEFDVDNFVGEIIELEIPAYPRHAEDDPSCEIQPREEPEEPPAASPFSVLEKFLDR